MEEIKAELSTKVMELAPSQVKGQVSRTRSFVKECSLAIVAVNEYP
jgi:hypothetical protein